MAKKKEKCSLFEEMLMWTSYRYCIGRHTYVTSLAGEMAQHYYNRLSDERMEFTAKDIRREIFDKMWLLPFNLQIHRMYDKDILNPIEVVMEFIKRENINSIDDFAHYSKVVYDVHTDTFTFDKSEPTIKSYFSPSDIDELIPWEELAACFDKKNHKLITFEYDGKTETYECFKTWVRKGIPCEDKAGYYRRADFGWEERWISVDDYIKSGNTFRYMNSDYIKEINEVQ